MRKLLAVALLSCSVQLNAQKAPFSSSWESLKQYSCPEWFRDAKFGIWAHWGPQAVPGDGDWYARGMYEPGNKHYDYHLKHYGHPTEFGYKDIIPQWKAEKWNPDQLMALYKKAGARYFVSMGVHHDNFDLWNSKYHRWNAVNMGPKRDIVGAWQKAAKRQGLYFGVSEHLAASFTWFQSSHMADMTGSKAGIPYDGANPNYADLYHSPADTSDKGWYSTNRAWHAEWFKRIHDLIENYKPDLLYSDGGLPFGETGRQLLADFYNDNIKQHSGKLEAVYNCKSHTGNTENCQFEAKSCVPDVERGGMVGIYPEPWQCDTSIGDWFYNRNWTPRGADWIIRMLVDIVSKNGNLLLNVELHPDGSISQDIVSNLEVLGQWMAVNGKAIYSSRPWLKFGEGPTELGGGSFNDSFILTSKDIRFTQSKDGKRLYAIVLGWPQESKVVIRSLASPNSISSVKLLGSKEAIVWTQTKDGLEINLPAKKVSDIAISFEITGKKLTPIN